MTWNLLRLLPLLLPLLPAAGLAQSQVQLEGKGRPVTKRALAMADAAVPPFDPAELPGPMERLSLQVRFCAH